MFWQCDLQNTLYSFSSPERGQTALNPLALELWKEIRTLETPETDFPLSFSNPDIPISAQKVTISQGRNCADLGFLQREWYFCLTAQPAETLLK